MNEGDNQDEALNLPCLAGFSGLKHGHVIGRRGAVESLPSVLGRNPSGNLPPLLTVGLQKQRFLWLHGSKRLQLEPSKPDKNDLKPSDVAKQQELNKVLPLLRSFKQVPTD